MTVFATVLILLTAVHCFEYGYVGKQPLAWKECCAEYWLKEIQESMDWCTGHLDITGILLKMVLNNIESINRSNVLHFWLLFLLENVQLVNSAFQLL